MSEELTPTARTILGFLASHPRSGYEIREAAKRAVSFFWGVSDGQLYPQLKQWVGAGEKLLLHQEELGDRVMGVVAGFLLWGGLVDTGPHAVTVAEQILHRQMGPPGRELVAAAADL